jgi:coproporphyrinogen III oxidase-like Fe-S oxidoreductase
MPSPIWAERGFEHNGAEAWQWVVQHISQNSNHDPMSIYIHVPFCDRRCKFCDCYSMPLGRRNRRAKEEQYLQTLLAEMEAWSHLPLLHHRPITTVHFGGGTPNCLSPDVFERIINQCQQCFHITPETERALESTSSLLTEEHLAQLIDWGFIRLHVGVQTLEEPLREAIGRREKADVVVQRLSHAITMGFITSVDVIYGLLGQTLDGLLSTLERLLDIGIHGVSLYQLNISTRNRRFLEKQKGFNRDALYDYVLFQVADQYLIRAGYHKNHFTHFAWSEDRNLYYNHAKRGEDLLALGTTADGVFGYYHYRHPEYAQYMTGVQPDIPVLEGGVRETALEQHLRPSVTALMTGGITRIILQQIEAKPLLENWLESSLLKEEPETDSFILTANGSWLVNDMIAELKDWVGTLIL